GLSGVRRGINVDVTYTSAGFNNGDRSVFHDRTDQAWPTTWNEHVDSPAVGHQHVGTVTTQFVNTLYQIGGEGLGFESFAQDGKGGTVGGFSGRPTAQNDGGARFDAGTSESNEEAVGGVIQPADQRRR